MGGIAELNYLQKFNKYLAGRFDSCALHFFQHTLAVLRKCVIVFWELAAFRNKRRIHFLRRVRQHHRHLLCYSYRSIWHMIAGVQYPGVPFLVGVTFDTCARPSYCGDWETQRRQRIGCSYRRLACCVGSIPASTAYFQNMENVNEYF